MTDVVSRTERVPRGDEHAGVRATLDTWQDAPYNRWAFGHVDELLPTMRIARGRAPEPTAGVSDALAGRLTASYTDGFLVVRDDEVLREWYRDGAGATDRHLLMSVSKSLCGLTVGTLVDDRLIDPAERVEAYVPALRGTAYGDATVQQVLDMTVAVDYDEDYRNPDSEVQQQDRVAGWRSRRAGDPPDTYAFLRSLRGSGRHGVAFQYYSAATDVLAWVVENVTGERYAHALSERLWSRLGCEDDAVVTVDGGGFAFANGGVCCTARDLARVGRLLLDDGVAGGARVVSADWIRDTTGGGSEEAAAGTMFQRVHPHGSYRNQWWVTGNERGNVYAVGIHGQYIWVDPPTRTVTVKFSSCPEPVTEEWNRVHATLFHDVCAAIEAGEPDL